MACKLTQIHREKVAHKKYWRPGPIKVWPMLRKWWDPNTWDRNIWHNDDACRDLKTRLQTGPLSHILWSKLGMYHQGNTQWRRLRAVGDRRWEEYSTCSLKELLAKADQFHQKPGDSPSTWLLRLWDIGGGLVYLSDQEVGCLGNVSSHHNINLHFRKPVVQNAYSIWLRGYRKQSNKNPIRLR